jgi:hypothetical protein
MAPDLGIPGGADCMMLDPLGGVATITVGFERAVVDVGRGLNWISTK